MSSDLKDGPLTPSLLPSSSSESSITTAAKEGMPDFASLLGASSSGVYPSATTEGYSSATPSPSSLTTKTMTASSSSLGLSSASASSPSPASSSVTAAATTLSLGKYQHMYSHSEGNIAEAHFEAFVEDLKQKTPFMSGSISNSSISGGSGGAKTTSGPTFTLHPHFVREYMNNNQNGGNGTRIGSGGTKRLASESPEDISNDVTISLSDWERRKEFVGFTKDDEEILSELHLVARTYADDVMVELYNRWLAFPEIRNYFKCPGVLDRVKEFQKNYFVTLTSGNYGMEYLENRLRIGRKHRDIGLHPRWYMGAYSIYMQIVFPRVLSAFEYDRKKRDRAVSALVKLISLDQEVALLSYFGQS